MVSCFCAGLLLVIAACSLKVCPFFYRTIRGLLCLHWTLINYLVSTSGSQAIDSNCLLISLATLLCLFEHRVNLDKGERSLTGMETAALCSTLFCLDFVCFVYGHVATTEISMLLLLFHVTLLMFVVYYQQTERRRLTTQEMVNLGSVDLFADSLDPFAFLGLCRLHYSVIVLSVFLQIPYLNSSRLLRDLVYLARSLGTLSMILTPAYLGGLIHFLKSSGSTALPQPFKVKKATSEVFNA